jgi:hypothetical protein
VALTGFNFALLGIGFDPIAWKFMIWLEASTYDLHPIRQKWSSMVSGKSKSSNNRIIMVIQISGVEFIFVFWYIGLDIAYSMTI